MLTTTFTRKQRFVLAALGAVFSWLLFKHGRSKVARFFGWTFALGAILNLAAAVLTSDEQPKAA